MTKKRERTLYLQDVPLEEARRRWLDAVSLPARVEEVPTAEAAGRVTAAPVFARLSSPAYPSAAMDGIAVRAADTFEARETRPVRLRREEQFVEVDTGDPLPEGFDAVIMAEHLHWVDAGTVEILEPARPWQHVRPVGEDVMAAELLLPDRHRLRPVDLGALLAGGVLRLPVLARPTVAILPTGDELVEPSERVERGQIVEFNSVVFAAYLREWGAEPVRFPPTPDDPEALRRRLEEALEGHDLVLLNAGSSAGSEDYSEEVLASLGEVLVHGVATHPGKPVLLGRARGKPVVGLPGYPVSAYLALDWFVRPLLARALGQPLPRRPRVRALAGRRIVSAMGTEDFVRVTVGSVGGRLVAQPLSREAGATMSLVRADGLLVVPPGSQGYEQGEEVEVELLRDPAELEQNIVVTGSHDMALDLLAGELRRIEPGLRLVSTHAGSMGAIFALRRREAHFGGLHLLDPESGEYNLPYVRKYLAGVPLAVVHLTYRSQGWIVAPGNPLGIRDAGDLARPEVRFVNRQRGAGTRLLLDQLLARAGVEPAAVRGYEREETTHLGVAAAVAAGTADVGLGVLSAARAMGLDFVPVAEERYDLCFARDFYESPRGRLVRSLIASPAFRRSVEALGGYDCRDAGTVWLEQ
ncbi:MAG: molybdopterin biosynthesis protein [Clostridia bacterium]|nr:molybdopterin biosynthesis protein [Clostridia bacterium]